MAIPALVQPLTIASQVVIQTNINLQQAREALEKARDTEVDQAVNNPNPERSPVEEATESASEKANEQGAGSNGDQGSEVPQGGVNLTA